MSHAPVCRYLAACVYESVCVCVEAGWRADLARALEKRGRGSEGTTEKERGGKNEREGSGRRGLKRSLPSSETSL